MSIKKRSKWRSKNLSLVYLGRNMKDMDRENDKFWHNASIEAKHLAMRQFVLDELIRLGLETDGPKLLRLTSILRRA